MIKTCCLLCFVCFTSMCFAQKSHFYYGTVLTEIDRGATATDTTRYLYCRNSADDHLSAYTVRDGATTEATAYHLAGTTNNLILYVNPLLTGQQTKDSLRITFQDKAHTVVINKDDRYTLFPAYYLRFKQEVKVRHSIFALLNLLSGAVGDYPVSATLYLVNYRPDLEKHIQQARIVTQRSQADMKDSWICKYFYNQYDKLDSVSAYSPEEVRLSKKVRYYRNKSFTIRSYLNVEDRQVTNRTISYGNQDRSPVKWQESYDEPGKNRETLTAVILTWHDLGMLRQIKLSPTEVLQLIKPIKTHDDNKK